MGIIERAIKLPVTVTVGALLIILFGFISLFRVPVQLTPDVEKPKISVRTIWPGASPEEVEKEIVIPQEDKLKTLEGLLEMESESQDSTGNITLTFAIGTDTDAALLKVSNKLNQVPSYPENVENPIILSASEQREAIAYIILRKTKGERSAIQYEKSYAENFIKPRLERVAGVGLVDVFGGRERELQVVLKPDALALYRLTVGDVISALRQENRNTSAGDFDEGKRRYILRVLGEYRSPEAVEAVVVKRVDGSPITVGDVASAVFGFSEADVVTRQYDYQVLVFRVVQSAGTNVLVVMEDLKRAIRDLNENSLKDLEMELVQAYDSTEYIYAAIDRVRENIFLGGSLAVIALLIFLRNISSVLIITVAIPISVIGTFLMITLFGRNINVITLAGMSFAIGLVVDSSIVVLENIYRHYQLGESRFQAALRGAKEVWGAILASTLTTIAVFVPVAFMEDEVGQLFRDIAIAISSAVFLSLLVSITVIPSMSSKILGGNGKRSKAAFSVLVWLGNGIAAGITGLVSVLLKKVWSRSMTVVVLTLFALVLTVKLIPEAEYLPEGNRNFVFGLLLPPPGYSTAQLTRIADRVAERLKPYWEDESRPDNNPPLEGPPIGNFFFVARARNAFMGCNSAAPGRARELIPVLRGTLSEVPGSYAVVQQGSLFARGIGEGRSIDIEIKGPALERLIQLGGEIFGKVNRLLPGSQVRPIPSLELGNPEIQVVPDREKASKVGLNASDIGRTLDVLLDGLKVDDYIYEGEEIDLVLKGAEDLYERTQDFDHIMLETPRAGLVPLNSVSRIELTDGPNQINHIEQQRAIVIRVIPPYTVSMEKAMGIARQEIVDPILNRGSDRSYDIRLTGTADDLAKTQDALKWDFILALVIIFLLMSALFENFFYPLVIMFSVPLASAGGFLGLWLVNTYLSNQPLDILTMLGFVILIGIVVNNAILIVHQSLSLIREENRDPREAIQEAVRIRIRPIFMSTTTSILGMSPLVFFPGAGSELYRGLGSVVIGGLALSTVFTLFLIPSLFSLTYSFGRSLKKLAGHG